MRKEAGPSSTFSWQFLFKLHFPILTLSNSDTFQFWHFPILTLSNSDTIQFWHFPILTLSNSDAFQFLSKWTKNGFWHFPIPLGESLEKSWDQAIHKQTLSLPKVVCILALSWKCLNDNLKIVSTVTRFGDLSRDLRFWKPFLRVFLPVCENPKSP